MPGENIIVDNVNGDFLKRAPIEPKRIVNVDKLEGKTCYFSLSGNLALREYEQKYSTFKEATIKRKVKEDLRDRILFAGLMFDNVVMHCSDPLRTQIVLEVLEEFVQWIENGKIMFIFSKSISNIERDYSKYINRKITEYNEGYFSDKEADSLRQPHINDFYIERVIALLNKSPYLIRKTANKEYSFDNLVLSDLGYSHHTGRVAVDVETKLSHIISMNLSLGQLLYIMKCERDSSYEYVFPIKTINNVCKNVKKHLEQGNTISRTAIVDSLKKELGEDLSEIQEKILNAISLRMDILYCRMNSGKQLILEFHPYYEDRSVFQLECLVAFLKIIAETDKKIKLDIDIINKLLLDESLLDLQLCYLASMAEVHEYMNFEQNEISRRFQKKFIDIANRNKQIYLTSSEKSIKNIILGDMS